MVFYIKRLAHYARKSLDRRAWKKLRQEFKLRSLAREPRFSVGTATILGRSFTYNDGPTFAHAYRDIFIREIYRFPVEIENPLILDCGANTGLSVIKLKKTLPASKIIAFEPDPEIFAILSKNVKTFELDGVQLEQKAVWIENTRLQFFSEGADAGRLRVPLKSQKHEITVNAVRLRDYLNQPIAFLKLDIEGAETAVVTDCADRLENVGSIFVEYHSFENEEQRLPDLLECLKSSGFRLVIESPELRSSPFFPPPSPYSMDLQLNIFGYRTPAAAPATKVAGNKTTINLGAV